jgi:hypothetical protein
MLSSQQKHRTTEEQEAASFMVGLSMAKDAKDESSKDGSGGDAALPPKKRRKSSNVQDSKLKIAPYPFFGYTDHSRDKDVDHLALLEEVDHVPSFPVKLHAILSDPDLKLIAAWDDHGRSFKILKPREFESKVLSRFFDHASMPSFQRQVNGWGFRRLTEGEYRNSYYEEHFLRSLPWLCRKMRRPRVGEKTKTCAGKFLLHAIVCFDHPVLLNLILEHVILAEHQPDLAAISAIYPVPDSPIVCREIQVVLETVKMGPRAKIPSNWMVDKTNGPTMDSPLNVPHAHVSPNEDMNQAAVQLPALSIPTANANAPFPLASTTAPSMPLNVSNQQGLIHLLQQMNGSSVQAAPQLINDAAAISKQNQIMAGVLAALRETNNIMLNTISNSVANNSASHNAGNALQALLNASQGQHPTPAISNYVANDSASHNAGNALQALLNASQGQLFTPVTYGQGVNGGSVYGNMTAPALKNDPASLLLASLQSLPGATAPVTPPSDASQLLSLLKAQAFANNQATPNGMNSSQISVGSSNEESASPKVLTPNEILELVKNGALGNNTLTLEQVNTLLQRK